MNDILCSVGDEDVQKLVETADEAQICEIKYNQLLQTECPSFVFKIVLEYYVHTLKIHKQVWREILIKYIGEDEASKYYNILKFDPFKKVIYKMDIQGCTLYNK